MVSIALEIFAILVLRADAPSTALICHDVVRNLFAESVISGTHHGSTYKRLVRLTTVGAKAVKPLSKTVSMYCTQHHSQL